MNGGESFQNCQRIHQHPPLPPGYQWLIDRKLVGFDAFTQLQPWQYEEADECFWASELWPHSDPRRIFIFARRQDNDDLAGFVFDENDVCTGVVLIHGWMSPEGFVVMQEFPDFWSWLKWVIDEIAEWASRDRE